MSDAMRFAVEAWAPEYGSSADEAALAPSEVPTDIGVEVGEQGWAPRLVPTGVAPPGTVLFVDGVRRVEARIWITGPDGDARPGICASFAAGAVRCGTQRPEARATVVATEVRRRLFCTGLDARDIQTRHGRFGVVAASDDSPDQLSLCLQQKMGELEVAVAGQASADQPGELIIVDGPLRQHRHLAGAVGYIKSQHRSYGPPVVLATVARLAPGERTPVFVVGERFARFSWYVRLPGEGGHALAGVVRCEAATDLGIGPVVELADRVAGALPRFASRPHKDPRAPQNLYPIAGLESQLRRRMGDPALLYRALRMAAVATTGTVREPAGAAAPA